MGEGIGSVSGNANRERAVMTALSIISVVPDKYSTK